MTSSMGMPANSSMPSPITSVTATPPPPVQSSTVVPSLTPLPPVVTQSTSVPRPSGTPTAPSTANAHARVALGVGLTMFVLAVAILGGIPVGFFLYRRFHRIQGQRPYESLHNDL